MGKEVNLEGGNAYENRGNAIQHVEGVVVNSAWLIPLRLLTKKIVMCH